MVTGWKYWLTHYSSHFGRFCLRKKQDGIPRTRHSEDRNHICAFHKHVNSGSPLGFNDRGRHFRKVLGGWLSEVEKSHSFIMIFLCFPLYSSASSKARIATEARSSYRPGCRKALPFVGLASKHLISGVHFGFFPLLFLLFLLYSCLSFTFSFFIYIMSVPCSHSFMYTMNITFCPRYQLRHLDEDNYKHGILGCPRLTQDAG